LHQENVEELITNIKRTRREINLFLRRKLHHFFNSVAVYKLHYAVVLKGTYLKTLLYHSALSCIERKIFEMVFSSDSLRVASYQNPETTGVMWSLQYMFWHIFYFEVY